MGLRAARGGGGGRGFLGRVGGVGFPAGEPHCGGGAAAVRLGFPSVWSADQSMINKQSRVKVQRGFLFVEKRTDKRGFCDAHGQPSSFWANF